MKQYLGISASDQARQHNGDVYNDCTITNVHGAGEVLDAETRCLRSLAFPHMERRGDIAQKTETTCNWIFRHSQYQEWIEDAGLLWIRGRAGSGKSTLMEFVVKQNQDLNELATDQDWTSWTSNTFVASFFFHRRGELLQRTTLGLFRSLLHQILRWDRELLSEFTKATKFERRCKEEGEPGVKWHWTESDLRDQLSTCIQKFGHNRVIRLYVDALDESGEASARDLMKYFHQLRSDTTLRRLSVCVSCRPYPEVIWDWDQCVIVEHGNEQDIATFLRVNFTTTTGWANPTLLVDIRREIASRASGVFQWAVVVTRRVLSMRGETKEYILADIAKSPSELSDLYETMLSQLSDSDKAFAFRILQWITFAARPLSLSELRHAVAIEATKRIRSRQDFASSIHWCENDEQMSERVLRLSQGLVAIVENATGEIVQFDHESVQDYMSDRGLSLLEKERPSDVDSSSIGRAHQYLTRACLRRLAAVDVVDADEKVTNYIEVRTLPLVEYAASYWTTHAEKAEAQRVSQVDLIELTEWPRNNILSQWTYLGLGYRDRRVTLQHVASRYGLCSILAALIPMTRSSTATSVIRNSVLSRWRADATDPKDDQGCTPLSLAAKFGHEAAVRLLLDASVSVDAKDRLGRTPLSWAAKGGHDGIARLLLVAGAAVNVKDDEGRAPLSLSTEEGHEATVKLLLAAVKINVDACDKVGLTPLLLAAGAGHETVVKLLLDTGKVNINAQSKYCSTPLSRAAEMGHGAVVDLLLATGKVDVNAHPKYGATPLSRAAEAGHGSIVQSLLATGKVDPNAQDRYGATAVMRAAKNGHREVVKLLLATNRVNLKLRNFEGFTAWEMANARQHWAVARLLRPHSASNSGPIDFGHDLVDSEEDSVDD